MSTLEVEGDAGGFTQVIPWNLHADLSISCLPPHCSCKILDSSIPFRKLTFWGRPPDLRLWLLRRTIRSNSLISWHSLSPSLFSQSLLLSLQEIEDFSSEELNHAQDLLKSADLDPCLKTILGACLKRVIERSDLLNRIRREVYMFVILWI